MKSKTHFNKIYVIESLPVHHLSTGKRLFEDTIIWLPLKLDGITSELVQPTDKSNFFYHLNKIAEETKGGAYPLLHIEAHGCEDGLKVANGDFIHWEQLRSALTEINVFCRNNLLLVLGACKGIHLFQITQPVHRAPFCGLIGPNKNVVAGDLERDFSEFYREFSISLDGNKALAKLNYHTSGNNLYTFFGCNYLFKVVYSNYHHKMCTGDALRQRIEDLTTKARRDPRSRSLSIKQIRDQIKLSLRKNQEEYFERFKEHFFMNDLYPENASRFDITFDEIVNDPIILKK